MTKKDQEKCKCEKDHIHETYSQGFVDGVKSQPQDPKIEKIVEEFDEFTTGVGWEVPEGMHVILENVSDVKDFLIESVSQAKEAGYDKGRHKATTQFQKHIDQTVAQEKSRIIGILEEYDKTADEHPEPSEIHWCVNDLKKLISK